MADVYDKGKFRELVIYVSQRCAADSSFGDIRLNKVLFFSDAIALQCLGRPITGARYQKLPLGPAPRALLPVRDEMIAANEVRVEKVGRPARTVTVPLRKPDLSRFREDEIAIVDEVIELFKDKTATHVSLTSHIISPGWNLVELREDIPLESQFISMQAPSDETLARGRELAEQYGW